MARTLMDHPTSTAMRVALTRTRPALAAPPVPRSNAAEANAHARAALSCEQPCDEACLTAVRPTWLLALMRTGTAHGAQPVPEEAHRGQMLVHRLLCHAKRRDSADEGHALRSLSLSAIALGRAGCRVQKHSRTVTGTRVKAWRGDLQFSLLWAGLVRSMIMGEL